MRKKCYLGKRRKQQRKRRNKNYLISRDMSMFDLDYDPFTWKNRKTDVENCGLTYGGK